MPPLPPFVQPLFSALPVTTPLQLLARLLAAMVLAGAVVWLYRRTRAESQVSPAFTRTLVLLSILVAMVTQVIGDNTARAFGLVGALSIVRFRTVVRDTQDTAFVICAVAMGMAAGAGWGWVAVDGLVVITLATFIMRGRGQALTDTEALFVLTVKIGLGHDVTAMLTPTLSTFLKDRRLLSMSTANKGTSYEIAYEGRLLRDNTADDFVATLNRIEGVQGVDLERKSADGE